MAVYVSDLLTVTPAPVDATPASTRTWQWLRGSTNISGATSTTYTTTTDDLGSSIFATQLETNFLGTTRATSAATETVEAYNPAALFRASEPGVWYDPNDITTLYKGTTNLTPVTTPGDAVSLMLDKSRGLVLGPQLVNNGTFAGGTTGWDNVTASLSVVDGEGIVTGGSSGYVRQVITTVVGKSYQVTCSARIGTTNRASLSLGGVYAETTSSTTTALFCLFTATGTSANLWLQVANAGTAFFDNVSVKEVPGNHATQATETKRPNYGIVPAGGRRNLLVQTENFAPIDWTKTSLTVSGNQVSYVGGLGGVKECVQLVTVPGGTANKTLTAYVTVSGSGTFRLKNTHSAVLDNFSANITATSTPQTVTLTVTNGAGAGNGLQAIAIINSTTDAAFNLTVHQFQLELSATATPYQRVTTQYDVTEAGVASLGYLQFDGTDDWMSTPTITPGIDKAQAFTGVRKFVDAPGGAVFEFGNLASDPGMIAIHAPNQAVGLQYRWSLRNNAGTVTDLGPTTGYAAPITSILTGIADISGDRSTFRIDGIQIAQSTADQGTGNFQAYPLYIGARVGGSLFLNGQLFPLIVRFGTNLTTARIQSTEIWVSGRTPGVDLEKFFSPTIYARDNTAILDRDNSTIERRAV